MSNDQDATPLLELHGISKRYPGTLANDGVNLTIMPGELHALVGENGAGKSTLTKCIYGVIRPDAGHILWQGQPIEITDPAMAQRIGIGMVFQHFSLFETLTVAQNIALSLNKPGGMRQLNERIVSVSHDYQLPIDPTRYIHDLSVGERQRVEVVRCLLQNPRLLIMDEPTSVLTPGEVELLFTTLRRLASEGCSILYISHKLEEVRDLCSRATVMRAARSIATCDPRAESIDSMACMMMGTEPPTLAQRNATVQPQVCLRLKGLSHTPTDPFGTKLHELNLEVHRGEIVGIAGVAGNGQEELLATLSGEQRLPRSNMIQLDDQSIEHLGPSQRRAMGLAFAPAERLGRGAVPDMSLEDNTCLTAYHKGLVHYGFVRGIAVKQLAQQICTRFKVVSGGIDAEAHSLSGGNLQKFVMGREISLEPRVLIAANPTWGVDVGAAITIRQALLDLVSAGTAVLLISEDVNELFEICDRIAAIYEGHLSHPVATAQVGRDEIGRWMAGLFDDVPSAAVEVH